MTTCHWMTRSCWTWFLQVSNDTMTFASSNWMSIRPDRVWSEFILNGIHYDAKKLADQSEALMFYIETQFYQRAMRPEIPAVLEEIRQMGLKIGLISNVNSRGQVTFNLKKYGLTGLL